LTVNTTASAAALSPSGTFDAAWLPLTGLGLVGIAVIALPRKRRRGSALLLTLLMGSLVWVVSCGSGQPPAVHTPVPTSKTSTVTVTGTSGNVTQSTTFSLTIN